jgi:hypothetical protein
MTSSYSTRARVAACVVALALAAPPAQASSIRPAFSPDGGVRCFDAQPFAIWNVYIVADLHDDAAANGITGAEFRVTGFDPAWQAIVTPSPSANITLGDPLGGVGCDIGFPDCQSGVNGIVLLYTVQVVSFTPIVPRTLQVFARPFCGPTFCCPFLTLCDADYTRFCVLGDAAEIPCPPVRTDAVTWSRMKSLFRR